MIETLAVLTVVAAVAALLIWWPRARQRRQPSERATRPMTHGTGRSSPAPGHAQAHAAREGEAAARLRRELAERMQAARLAREKAAAAPKAPSRPAGEPATGFAETAILEDQLP
jgi:hypothetical protein